jgi:type II secretory pathway component PulM
MLVNRTLTRLSALIISSVLLIVFNTVSAKQVTLNLKQTDIHSLVETVEDDNLIPWLATLEQEQAVLVAEIILQQNEKIGMVKAKINLARE